MEPWAAALALGWCALRLGRGLGPAPFYNSDCAVPILVMQGMGEGAFTFFYPRQDRFLYWFNEEWRTRMGRERLG